MARSKINLLFFVDLFSYTQRIFYSGKIKLNRWNGFRLLAVDGTSFRIPDTEENRCFIGVHKNQHREIASCKILAIHDLLNRVFIKIIPHPRTVAEITVLHLNFDELPDDSITIYDRHYCDSLLLDRHLKSGKPCVIRMRTKGIKAVDKFLESGKIDDVIELRIGDNAYKSAKNRYGLRNKHPRFSKFKIRLIRIELNTGETEVLATNLFDKEKYPVSDFNYLYSKRWGVETAFDEIKNQLKLGLFSGYRTDFVLQDLWSVFIFYNIRAIFLQHAQDE